ncbi:hypothetical protein PO909_006340 [Leuciscus waleckii]
MENMRKKINIQAGKPALVEPETSSRLLKGVIWPFSVAYIVTILVSKLKSSTNRMKGLVKFIYSSQQVIINYSL